MLRIPCPHCGVRDQTEFVFGGEVREARPTRPDQCDDEAWSQYLFYRENKKGVHAERWVHRFGCRQWFVLERDTASHEIHRSYPVSP